MSFLTQMDRSKSVASESPLAPSVQLPPELLTAVFSQILPDLTLGERGHVVARFDRRDTRTYGEEVLRNVSLTCWSFHDIALPNRFKHVELHARGNSEHTESHCTATEPFARLAASERLRNLVKVVSLRVYINLPKSAEAILCGMLKLKVIKISSPFEMTQLLYNHICSLRSLHRLEVAIPHVCSRDTDTIIALDSYEATLHSLVITYRLGGGPYGMGGTCRRIPRRPWTSLPTWLTFLALSPSLRDLHIPMPVISLPFTGFASHPIIAPSLHLGTLNVTRPDAISEWEEFRHFVAWTPLITNLILGDGGRDDDDDDTLTDTDPPFPSNLLPALQRFEGDLRFAKLVVPGRPVSAIELSSMLLDDSPCHLRPLSHSTATVRSLIIHDKVSLKLFAVIATLFPDLEELRVLQLGSVNARDWQEWLKNNFSSDLEKLRRLRTLRISMWDKVTADHETDAFSRLPDKHSLEHVAFGPVWSWHKASGIWARSEVKL